MRLVLALACAAALCGCASRVEPRPDPLAQGYRLGAADAAKELYWARQDLERLKARLQDAPALPAWREPVPAGPGPASETAAAPAQAPAPGPAGGRP